MRYAYYCSNKIGRRNVIAKEIATSNINKYLSNSNVNIFAKKKEAQKMPPIKSGSLRDKLGRNYSWKFRMVSMESLNFELQR